VMWEKWSRAWCLPSVSCGGIAVDDLNYTDLRKTLSSAGSFKALPQYVKPTYTGLFALMYTTRLMSSTSINSNDFVVLS
jgi:hypothetical protein